VYLRHLSSLQFLSYVAFFTVLLAALWRLLPGKAPPVRTVPYPAEELGAHDPKVAKYFLAGGGFLVLGSLHMLAKNLPWPAEWLARAGYAGHLVRDLANTHVMIVGGGTLIATGLCWYVLPRIVGRPLASDALAQCAFWFTAAGLLIFYVAFVGNGIAIGRLVAHGWDYETAKANMGKWYKVPVGIGAGVMGVGYWCFAANVFLTVFHARLVRVPKPSGHLWKYLATGAAGLTVGTVQGVIQVQPAHEAWLHRAGHAGEWIDPISHAHVNLVTGLTMLVAGAVFYLVPLLGGTPPSRKSANTCFYLLLGGSLAFYAAALYLGFHEGGLVVGRGLTPEQAEEATPLHPYLIMAGGTAMFAAFWLLLVVLLRCFRSARGSSRGFVLAGCAALAVGTLQGPVQAFPAAHELLDRGGDAGGVIVNLHAQLNMLGGLMVILVGVALALLAKLGARRRPRLARTALVGAAGGTAVYYAAGMAFSALEAHSVADGRTFAAAVAELEPWPALLLTPAALAMLGGFGAYAVASWSMSARQRRAGRQALAAAPSVYAGRVPKRVRRRSPAALAGYELPMALLGFPGIGWLFAGFPLIAAILLLVGPVLAWAVIPSAFSPYGTGPLRGLGWKFEFVWLSATALLSAAALYRAHRRRQRRFEGTPPRGRRRRRGGYRTRVSIAVGAIFLVLVSLPFVPAVSGIGTGSVRYAYQTGFTKDVTGQFLTTPKGTVALFSWRDPQDPYPPDALRLHSRDARSFLVRAAAVDRPNAYRLFDLSRSARVRLAVRASAPRALRLVPSRPLASGRYLFVGTHQGMFGGRDFAYLTVVPRGAPVTPISSRDRGSVPAVMDAFLPIAAALVAGLFSALLVRSFLRRPAGQKALWAGGFALFAVAALTEALAQRAGWSPALFRTYYLAGGVLTVAYLGAGSAWLFLPRRGRDALAGALAVATAAALITVALAPLDPHLLATTSDGRPPVNGALGGHAYLWAIALNSFGTVFLVGGSLYSILRRQRVRANLWIGGGALVVALATGLSRAGNYSFVYLGELLGIALMFSGFTFVSSTARRTPVAEPRPRLEQRAVLR
jgi:membrane protein implicated in regulation of membrane protease activity